MADALEIVIWNVASGSAIFARTSNRRTILMDAGASEDFSPAEQLHRHYGLRSTDLFILSLGDAPHVRDLPNVSALIPPSMYYRNPTAPKALLFPADPPRVAPLLTYDRFEKEFRDRIVQENRLHLPAEWGGLTIGTFYNEGDLHQFDCLNDYSLVTVLDYGCLRFVFPGDLGAPGWEAITNDTGFVLATSPYDERFRILVAPDHGHEAGVYQPFLDYFQPHLSIISGPDDDPRREAQPYFESSSGLEVRNSGTDSLTNCRVLTTRRNGSIRLRATAKKLAIEI